MKSAVADISVSMSAIIRLMLAAIYANCYRLKRVKPSDTMNLDSVWNQV